MQEQRPLLLVAYGPDGIAPLRAALEWAPLQAHASTNPITLVYAADSMPSAAFVKDWDQWRDFGVTVLPMFLHIFDENAPEGGAVFEPDSLTPATADGAGAPLSLSLRMLRVNDTVIE